MQIVIQRKVHEAGFEIEILTTTRGGTFTRPERLSAYVDVPCGTPTLAICSGVARILIKEVLRWREKV